MKHVLIIILLTLSTQIFAQNKDAFYVQMGYSQASQSPSIFNVFETSFWRQNIHNVFCSIEYYRNLNELSSVGMGVQLVEKGFKNSYSVDFPGSTYHLKYFFKLDYIELPIMYRQKFKNKLQSFSVNAGVVNSFLIKSAQGSASILNNFENRGTSFNPAVFNKFE